MKSQESKLAINIAPLSFSKAVIEAGYVENPGDIEAQSLKDHNWKTHAFRLDNRDNRLYNIALANQRPIGNIIELPIEEHLFLVAKAIQQAILIRAATKSPVAKWTKELVFYGNMDSAHLLSQACKEAKVEPIKDLEVAVRYSVDCRMFWDTQDKPYLGLVLNVGLANIINLNVQELLEHGVLVAGKYIGRREADTHPFIQPKLGIIGQVAEVRKEQLHLSDTRGETEVDANEVFLEPTTANLHECIEKLAAEAPQILGALKRQCTAYIQPLGKLAKIQDMLTRFRGMNLFIGGDLSITIGELLQESKPLFPPTISTERPKLLFGSQGTNSSLYPDIGIQKFGPYMYMQHSNNAPLIGVLCESQYRGRVEQFIRSLQNGYPDELWTDERNQNPFPNGLVGKYRLSRVRFEFEEVNDSTASAYEAAAKNLLARLPDAPQLGIIQIKEGFNALPSSKNPYLVTKAIFMSAGVPTQSVKIEKMDGNPSMIPYLLNNVALACYAKLDGLPWVMSTLAPATHEIILGVGQAEVANSRLGDHQRYIGINTVFQGDGRYHVWGLTREVSEEEYAAALLQSLETTVLYVRNQETWQEGDRVRVIFHIFKPLKNMEIVAAKKLVQKLTQERFVVKFAFVDISSTHAYYLFDKNQQGRAYGAGNKGAGVPPRGACLQLDRFRALIQLTGPLDVKTGDQGAPQPLLIEVHHDSDFTDLTYLARQVYHFSFMSWQSFMPASEPVTVRYSRLIARMLGNLRTVPNWDSTALTIGGLRGKRWFL